MEIIRIKDAKEYCEAYDVERNDWAAGAIDKVLAGSSVIQYRNENGHLVTYDLEYIHSHMQSLKGFDDALHDFMANGSEKLLRGLERRQASLLIDDLANSWEIGK